MLTFTLSPTPVYKLGPVARDQRTRDSSVSFGSGCGVGAVQTVLDALKRSRQCHTDVVGPTTEVSSHEAEIGHQ